MPDRIIREKILDSETVNRLSWPAEVFYRRLMSVVDDFGRYDGRVSVLRARLYPVALDRVSEGDVGKWMRETAEAGLVNLYHVETRPLLEILKFDQRLRAKRSRWPPPSSAVICQQVPADAGACTHPSYSDSDSDSDSVEGGAGGNRKPEGFRKPTLEAVKLLFAKTGLPEIEADKFFDYYTANGWKVGKNPMKSLDAAVRNWKRNYEERRYDNRSTSNPKTDRNAYTTPPPEDLGKLAEEKSRRHTERYEREAKARMAGQADQL